MQGCRLLQVSKALARQVRPGVENTLLKSYRVCVVDDHEENVAVLCEGLRQHGYQTVSGASGEEALRLVSTEDVDLVLLDVNLPDIDGFEVCRRIKADAATEGTAVIFCTVRGEKVDLAEGFRAGACDYITKPFNLPMVMLRVGAALRAREIQRDGTDDGIVDGAYTDLLTGLRNRRFLMERLQEEVEKAHRYDFPVSFVLFDIDEIEANDDELGPVSLDDLVAEVAMSMNAYTRTFDTLSRIEGSLFGALLPHCTVDQARAYASKIMEEVNSTTFSDPSFPTTATLSAGITCCQNGVAYSADYVLGEAMRSLLQAKSQNGERVVAKDLAK